jgi:hypothetical protein
MKVKIKNNLFNAYRWNGNGNDDELEKVFGYDWTIGFNKQLRVHRDGIDEVVEIGNWIIDDVRGNLHVYTNDEFTRYFEIDEDML